MDGETLDALLLGSHTSSSWESGLAQLGRRLNRAVGDSPLMSPDLWTCRRMLLIIQLHLEASPPVSQQKQPRKASDDQTTQS